MSSRRKVLGVLGLEILGCLGLAAVFVLVLMRGPGSAVPLLLTAASTRGATLTALPSTLVPASMAMPTASSTQSPDQPSATNTLAPSATATLTPTVAGTVSENGSGLRLRQTPGTAGAVVASLKALAPLQIVGRTADAAWLEVDTADRQHGWVIAVYVKAKGDVAGLAVTGQAEDTPENTFSYLSGVTAHAREIFLQGQTLGNRSDVFSKVGDSNTDNPAFLTPFDQGTFSLGPYSDLAASITYFSGSFSRVSLAAVGGFSTAKVLDPSLAGAGCSGGESPLACEYRLNRPSVALILLGTGDQHTWQGFEARYRQIIETTIGQGIVPVLITKADDLESIENTAPAGFTNDTIRRLALEYDVPLLDLRRAVEPLPNRGCIADGFHYSTPADGQTTNFDAAHLAFGFNMRNLTALEALDALRRTVLYAPLS